jgi:hypothetical protein
MQKPSFFIIGAPKCGTTALCEYLKRHPRIGFSEPKEPAYFCTDFPVAGTFRDDRDYLERCFGHLEGRNLLTIGEGSTLYFYSTAAVGNILRFAPEAKFIVMLRNPLDLVPALHAERLAGLDEDVSDFEKAWSLSAARAEGRNLPRYCPDPRLVDYATQGRLGLHLQRIYGEIPESRRKTILFEDFAADTRRVYAEVLAFLGVPDDGQADFQRMHERSSIKHQRVYEFGRRPPRALVKVMETGKRVLGIERLNILPRLIAWTQTRGPAQAIAPALRARLKAEFSEDIDLLAGLLNRDLSHWKA